MEDTRNATFSGPPGSAHPTTSAAKRFSEMVMLAAGVASVPAAVAVPLFGGVVALLVFAWSAPRIQRAETLGRSAAIISGLGIVLAVATLALQLPFGDPSPATVDLVVRPA